MNHAALELGSPAFTTNTYDQMKILTIRYWHQEWQFSINPQAEILDCFKARHVLRAHSSGHDYLNFLQTHLNWLLEDLSLNMFLHMWFQNDGAPPRYSGDVCKQLSANYPGLWIGYGCEVSVSWPACSSDLYIFNFFCRDIWETRSMLV